MNIQVRRVKLPLTSAVRQFLVFLWRQYDREGSLAAVCSCLTPAFLPSAPVQLATAVGSVSITVCFRSYNAFFCILHTTTPSPHSFVHLYFRAQNLVFPNFSLSKYYPRRGEGSVKFLFQLLFHFQESEPAYMLFCGSDAVNNRNRMEKRVPARKWSTPRSLPIALSKTLYCTYT